MNFETLKANYVNQTAALEHVYSVLHELSGEEPYDMDSPEYEAWERNENALRVQLGVSAVQKSAGAAREALANDFVRRLEAVGIDLLHPMLRTYTGQVRLCTLASRVDAKMITAEFGRQFYTQARTAGLV